MSYLRTEIIDLVGECRTRALSSFVELEDDFRERLSMDASSGHGGALLGLAVVKEGITAEEVSLAKLLSGVAPAVLGNWPGGYVMEYVPHVGYDENSLCVIHQRLDAHVWTRGVPQHSYWGWWDYRPDFLKRFGHEMPSWIYGEGRVVTHGDPTLANARFLSPERVVLIDPKPPGNGIPPFASVDRGKILQSMMGWEIVRTGRRVPEQVWPLDGVRDRDLLAAAWWARVHLLRILQREKDSHSTIENWALSCENLLSHLLQKHLVNA